MRGIILAGGTGSRLHPSLSARASSCCVPEEAAWRRGYLSDDELRERAELQYKSGYFRYPLELLDGLGAQAVSA